MLSKYSGVGGFVLVTIKYNKNIDFNIKLQC